MSSDNWVRIPVVAGFVDFLCGANIAGNIISAEKRCNYPGRSRVTRLVCVYVRVLACMHARVAGQATIDHQHRKEANKIAQIE